MHKRDIIVIGASAGGVEAVTNLVRRLPSTLEAALFVTTHFPKYSFSVLPNILNRSTALCAKHPQDGDLIESGRIYVAPPNYHLILHKGYVRLLIDAQENGHRPAIDPMFRSAAQAYRSRVIGVILSGMLDDGTAGLSVIKNYGGVAIVQNPETASFPGMPLSAIEHVDVDYVLPVEKIADQLIELVKAPLEKGDDRMLDETKEAEIVSTTSKPSKRAIVPVSRVR